jgi:hypothetical protein
VAETVESAMSSQTASPDVPVDEPSTAESPAEAGTDPVATGDDLPFEWPELGVGGFLPHLDAATDD